MTTRHSAIALAIALLTAVAVSTAYKPSLHPAGAIPPGSAYEAPQSPIGD
jgi:hypothetical protein